MRKRLRKAFPVIAASALLVSGFAVRPASAIFGVGDIVFDPSAYSTLGEIWTSNISMGARLIEEYNQLVKIYSNAMQLYELTTYTTQYFSMGMKYRWMTAVMMGVNNYTQSQYGETIAWPMMMNGHPEMAPRAWASATVPMMPFNNFYNSLPVDSQQRIAAKIASIETIDGASVQCMQTIAQHRQNSDANTTQLQSLFQSILSADPAANSLVQHLDIQNGAWSEHLNAQREQGLMHACEVQNQIVGNKIARDQEVNSLNLAISRQSAVQSTSWDGKMAFDAQLP